MNWFDPSVKIWTFFLIDFFSSNLNERKTPNWILDIVYLLLVISFLSSLFLFTILCTCVHVPVYKYLQLQFGHMTLTSSCLLGEVFKGPRRVWDRRWNRDPAEEEQSGQNRKLLLLLLPSPAPKYIHIYYILSHIYYILHPRIYYLHMWYCFITLYFFIDTDTKYRYLILLHILLY